MHTTWLSQRWHGRGGIAELLKISFPLILSFSSGTIQLFVDRMYLGWYDLKMMSAAPVAGVTWFMFISLFLGTGSYVNTFVAQYSGAGRPKRVGPAVWQGIYFSLLAGVVCFGLIPLAGPIFDFYRHGPDIRPLEIEYFQILCYGAGPHVLAATLAGFYTGRGRTWMVLWVNVVATLVNVALDYGMIFGRLGFPEMGLAGAAWATVIAYIVNALIFIALFLRRSNRQNFATGRPAVDRDLFARLLRYGLPHGVQFMLDVLGFTLFMALIGQISAEALAATNVAFQLNMLGFMPMIGIATGLTVLVGQALGQNNPALARRTTWTAFFMTYAYMLLVASSFFFIPEVLAGVFRSEANAAQFETIMPQIKLLLRFVAFYCLFDTGNIIFSATLKGAGDTRYVMFVSVLMSWVIMVVPSWWIITNHWGGADAIYRAWICATIYICLLAVMFALRYRQGKWASMRVIEESGAAGG